MNQQAVLEVGDRLPLEEIKKFYMETGIDITGVIQEMVPCAQECWIKLVMTFICYARGIKEFMDLSLHDRIATLKCK